MPTAPATSLFIGYRRQVLEKSAADSAGTPSPAHNPCYGSRPFGVNTFVFTITFLVLWASEGVHGSAGRTSPPPSALKGTFVWVHVRQGAIPAGVTPYTGVRGPSPRLRVLRTRTPASIAPCACAACATRPCGSCLPAPLRPKGHFCSRLGNAIKC